MQSTSESARTISTASTAYSTPAHSVARDKPQDTDEMLLYFESVPIPDSWFIIRARQSTSIRYLSLIGGKVCLQENPHSWGGFRWRITSTDGWIGFQEFTTGRYLGHDDKGGIVVKALSQGDKERLVVSHQSGGGYYLSVFREIKEDQKVARMVLQLLNYGDEACLLSLDSEEPAALWEFCKVENPQG